MNTRNQREPMHIKKESNTNIFSFYDEHDRPQQFSVGAKQLPCYCSIPLSTEKQAALYIESKSDIWLLYVPFSTVINSDNYPHFCKQLNKNADLLIVELGNLDSVSRFSLDVLFQERNVCVYQRHKENISYESFIATLDFNYRAIILNGLTPFGLNLFVNPFYTISRIPPCLAKEERNSFSLFSRPIKQRLFGGAKEEVQLVNDSQKEQGSSLLRSP